MSDAVGKCSRQNKWAYVMIHLLEKNSALLNFKQYDNTDEILCEMENKYLKTKIKTWKTVCRKPGKQSGNFWQISKTDFSSCFWSLGCCWRFKLHTKQHCLWVYSHEPCRYTHTSYANDTYARKWTCSLMLISVLIYEFSTFAHK